MEVEQVVDNVMAVIDEAAEKIPKKWGNMRSLHLKAVNSVALPIYQAVPEIGLKIEIGEGEDSGVEEVIDGDDEVVEEKSEKKRTNKKRRITYMDGAALYYEELIEEDDELEGEKEKNKKRKKGTKEVSKSETHLDGMEIKIKENEGNGGEGKEKRKGQKLAAALICLFVDPLVVAQVFFMVAIL